ncbi:MAG: arginine--tRNA ligase [Deltaproteobacteria bacterium]
MYAEIEKKLTTLLRRSLEVALGADVATSAQLPAELLILDIPKEKAFGDLSLSAAMKLARVCRKSPRQVAQDILEAFGRLHDGLPAGEQFVEKTEIKGAGFINFFLKKSVFEDMLRAVCRLGPAYGRSDAHGGRKVLLEFVSANPTGALSVAHARQAAVGDALANILAAAGCRVTREFYLNDEGNQIAVLGRSIDLRLREQMGEAVAFPQECYQGDYIGDLAARIIDDKALLKKVTAMGEADRADFMKEYGVREILAVIRGELDGFGVRFDVWYSQKEKVSDAVVAATLSALEAQGHIYAAEGALWFRSTAYGDDKDRVVKKTDGAYTYLAPDIAYHKDKFARGFEELVNIWGPDHHGYIPRLRAAVQALGHPAAALHVIIVQLATLYRDGAPVPMSTRKGQYVTLTELLTEVGRDAARFFFLMRKTDSHLDFDLALAKKQTPENPVYYVQYAHARVCGILTGAGDRGSADAAPLERLVEEEERDLMTALFSYGFCVEVCAAQYDPYSMTAYLQSLAATFHKFYDKHKVLTDDPALAEARLVLVRAVKTVLANGLTLLGVSAPERM